MFTKRAIVFFFLSLSLQFFIQITEAHSSVSPYVLVNNVAGNSQPNVTSEEIGKADQSLAIGLSIIALALSTVALSIQVRKKK